MATRSLVLDALDRLIADLLRGRARWPDATDALAFLARAHLQGVGTLLHASLERDGAGVPAAVREVLRGRTLHGAAIDLACRSELVRLLGLMAGRGLDAFLIKGTPLAYTYYTEPAWRERADTDLLVRPGDRAQLFELLAAQGYRRAEAAGHDATGAEASFSKDGAPLVLDVHWRLRSSPLLSGVLTFEQIAAQCVPVPRLGPYARAPGPVHAVLLAAVHRAAHHQSPFYAGEVAHRGDRLVWLYDLHLLAPSLTTTQAEALVAHAARHRVAGLCLDALRATQEAFGTPLPVALVEELERAAVHPEPSMVLLRGGRRRLLLAELRAVRGWTERARWLREHALPPGDYMLRKYDTRRRWLLPALYVRRALGWLVRA